MTKILLAGPRGNLAQAFTAYMKREHPEVTIVRLMPFPFSLQKLHEQLAGGTFDYFVNCVGLGKDSDSIQSPYDYFETNAWGVMNHLEMLRLYSPRTRYLTLGSVYETDKTTPYAASKRIAAELVRTYRETYGLFAVTARLGFTEYYNRHESYLSRKITSGVARIKRAIDRGEAFEPLELRDLDERYCWTWAEDVGAGMWAMLNAQKPADYSLTSGEYHSVREFAQIAFEEAGVDLKWLDSCSVPKTSGVVGGGPVIGFSAQTELGWTPRCSFEELVRKMTRHDLEEIGL